MNKRIEARKPRHHRFTPSLRISLAAGWFLVCIASISKVDAVQTPTDFDQQIAPILVQHCVECHRGKEPAGGLLLTSREGWMLGGDSGSAINLNSPSNSHVLKRIEQMEMPPPVKGIPQTLSQHEQKLLKSWIANDLPWPENRELDLFELTNQKRAGRDWWSLQPLTYSPKETTTNESADVHPVDQFVLAKQKQLGLTPAPKADRRTLIRRVFYTLIGLPPTQEEMEQLINDDRPDAWELLIDNLLSRPQYGERWGRHWLDVVRYADTSGYERDQTKSHAWKYRDWVVSALNSDMSYSRFVEMQLAGDESNADGFDGLIATGFLRLGTWNDEPNDPDEYQYERLEDLVHTTSSAFLGLTVKCARCHAHKFDPIEQDDYYRLASIFWTGPIQPRKSDWLGGPSPEEVNHQEVLAWVDVRPHQPALQVFKNGDPHEPLHQVTMETPSFVRIPSWPLNPPDEDATTSHYRRQFAKWVTAPDNPLTWRVIANRIWQHHFGKGLVATPNNFGFLGTQPSHPLLLDWLAAYLIANKGSLKSLHRLILTSETWKQSSGHANWKVLSEIDPSNRFLWHASRRRLDAEALRDSLLASAGVLDLRIGGPGFYSNISAQALEGLSRKSSIWNPSPEAEQNRRSLYQFMKRGLLPPMMRTFDLCESNQSVGNRNSTTVPTQALTLMNHDFVHLQSHRLAARVAQENRNLEERIRSIWIATLNRNPTKDEQQSSLNFINSQQQAFTFEPKKEPTSLSLAEILGKTSLYLDAMQARKDPRSGRVNHIGDLSSNRSDASQNLPEHQPTLSKDQWNGNPYIWFDGKRRFLDLSGEPITQNECTVVAVVSDEGPAGHREIISNWNSSGNIGTSFFIGLTKERDIRITDAFTDAGKLDNPQTPFLLSVVCNQNQVRVRQTGREVASRNRSLENRRFDTPWVVGQQGNIQGEFWKGGIGSILVFNEALENSELEQLESHLATKYGIQLKVDEERLDPTTQALASLVRVLFNSNEFIYLD